MYTDSQYTFATVHIYGVIYLERELLTAEEMALTKALKEPKGIAIVYWLGHQKFDSPVIGVEQSTGADEEAQKVALRDTRDL